MLSTWKDIAVFLDATPPDGQKIGRHAAAIASRHKAHLVGVYGILRDSQLYHDSYARGEKAIGDVIAKQRHARERKVLSAGKHFADLSNEYGVGSEFRIVWSDIGDEDTALRALHCDLIIAAHPTPQDLPESWSAERLLLNTGTPVLLIT